VILSFSLFVAGANRENRGETGNSVFSAISCGIGARCKNQRQKNGGQKNENRLNHERHETHENGRTKSRDRKNKDRKMTDKCCQSPMYCRGDSCFALEGRISRG